MDDSVPLKCPCEINAQKEKPGGWTQVWEEAKQGAGRRGGGPKVAGVDGHPPMNILKASEWHSLK